MPVSKKKKYPKKDFTHTRGYKRRHPKKESDERNRGPMNIADIIPYYMPTKPKYLEDI